ncbi:hypothetical protein D3C87_1165420 [compost metagenome]
MFSTMTMLASTIMPRPMARPPKLMRLPGRLKSFIIPKAKSIASGMVKATIKLERRFQRKNKRTATTMTPPSIRDFSTECTAFSISSF